MKIKAQENTREAQACIPIPKINILKKLISAFMWLFNIKTKL